MGKRRQTFLTPFPALLKRLRNEAGYSQVGLGSRLRPDIGLAYAKQYAYQLEAGKILPCVLDIKRLAKIFHVDSSVLEKTISDYSYRAYAQIEERQHVVPPSSGRAVVGSSLAHMPTGRFEDALVGIVRGQIRYVQGNVARVTQED